MKAAFWINLLKYGLGLGLLAYVIIVNWSGLKEVFSRPVHFGPLILAAVIASAGLLITFVRWHLLVRAVGLPFSLYNAIRLGLVGYYFNTFLPGSIGGDIVKAYAIAKEQSRRTVAVATVLIDRIIGLWALIWFVAIAGTVFWFMQEPILTNSSVLRGIVLFTGVFVFVSMSLWMAIGFLSESFAERLAIWLGGIRRVGGSLAELWRACWMYRKQPRAVFIAMILSMIGHVGWVAVFHFSVRAFETPNPAVDVGSFEDHLIVVPIGMTVSALIPVPGGIGSGEAAYGELYKIIGKPEVNGVVGCMSQRVIFFGLGFLGYLVYSRMRSGIPVERNGEQPVVAPPDPGVPIADPVVSKS